MEKVLADILRNRCVVYLDDLLVHGNEFEVALANLREVFLAIRRANLRARVLEMVHGHAGAGHFGVTKTLQRLRARFY